MNTLNAFITAMLAISIAAERLVAIVKSAWPWLAKETTLSNGSVDLGTDKLRSILVFLLAFCAAWITAAFLCVPDKVDLAQAALTATIVTNSFHLLGNIQFPGFQLCAPVVGLLGTGGSALWSSLLNYSSALKDIKIQARDTAQGVTQSAAPAAASLTSGLAKGSTRSTTA